MDLIISEWFNLVLERPFKVISAHVNKVRRLKCEMIYFYQEHELKATKYIVLVDPTKQL